MTVLDRLPSLVLACAFIFPLLGRAETSARPPSALSVAGLSLQPNGIFEFDGVTASVGHFDPQWVNLVDQPLLTAAAGFPKKAADAWQIRGTLPVTGATAPLILTQKLARIDAHSFRATYDAACDAKPGLPTQEMFLKFDIPVATGTGKPVVLDGVPHQLPVDFGEQQLYADGDVFERTLIIPGATGPITITGRFSVIIQDQREWHIDTYAVRLRFSPPQELLTRAGLEVILRHTPGKSGASPAR